MQTCVLGAGSWGTTVAALAAGHGSVRLWSRSEDLTADINGRHRNGRYLEGFDLPVELVATSDLGQAVAGADVVVAGVPSVGFRDIVGRVVQAGLAAEVPIVSLTKGLEPGTNLRMTEVCAELAPDNPAGVLTGPNLAKEILAGAGAAAVLAMPDPDLARRLQPRFGSDTFRVYVHDDVVGCELGGALKNVIALASGMADGLGSGANTRAAIMTRGLAELSRLGQALGGRPETFAGLAGMGDLVATCISPQSRNRFVGEQLGRGKTIAEVSAGMDQVAEGVRTAPVVVELARRAGVEIPIAEQVAAVLTGQTTVIDAHRSLLGRDPRVTIETAP